MYPDPKRVRNNRITLRLDDYEYQLISALANYQGDQPSTMARELLLREAQQVLTGDVSVESRVA
ncbi:hypothetical protein [Mitsuaria sp. GD03876]|uniref:hypothetical protein n=1 Tax=Mitsuaria sp. GD03876 TaxID=2975399 RepID=UPI00244D7077|nr:hypothetical protein [Mitsuaria sp. GD03876]MDH0866469.1 hypothetical protein [Mitsuaria sp. GD03876]